jgi:hypothetical protein
LLILFLMFVGTGALQCELLMNVVSGHSLSKTAMSFCSKALQ